MKSTFDLDVRNVNELPKVKPTLDFDVVDVNSLDIKTKYCATAKLHNLHIEKAIARGYPSIPVAEPNVKNSEPFAVVCSGPSLKDSWQAIKDFKVILTCSGAHDFLIERGIIPQFHMETDPRQHKSVFTKNPRQEITYLIASNCHPDVFNNLKGKDVRLWHVVSGDDLYKIPRGHWMITGGCNVGLRALVMARLMGYVDVHVFGMDCSSDSKEYFHANFHPNEPKKKGRRIVKVAGREFVTSDVFLECARQFLKETMMLSDAKFTLHGDGLLQALAVQQMGKPEEIEKRRQFVETRGANTIAVSLPRTISNEYAELNRKLHESNWDYGGHGDQYADVVNKLVKKMGVHSVLDYGCGKGLLAQTLDFPIWEYDPAIPGKEAPPRPAEFVVCTDVLEHIEPENLTGVLEDIKRVLKCAGFFAIHTGPSGKTLADGRNTHLIQQGETEWRNLLSKYFDVVYCQRRGETPWLYIVVRIKGAGVRQLPDKAA